MVLDPNTGWSEGWSLGFRGAHGFELREEVNLESILPYILNNQFVDSFDYAIRKVLKDTKQDQNLAGTINDIDNMPASIIPYQAERVGALAYTDLFITPDGENYFGREVLKRTKELNTHIGKKRALDILSELFNSEYEYKLGQVQLDPSDNLPVRQPDGNYTFTVDETKRYNAIEITIFPKTTSIGSGEEFLTYATEAFRRHLPLYLFAILKIGFVQQIDMYVHTLGDKFMQIYDSHLLPNDYRFLGGQRLII